MEIGFVIYGSLSTISGGYLYDRKLIGHLRSAGNTVHILSLPLRNYGRHLADNFDRQFFRRLVQAPIDLLIQDELNHPSLVLTNHRLRRCVCYPIITIVHHLRSDENHPLALLLIYRYVEKQYLRSVDGFVLNSQSSRMAVSDRIGREPVGILAYPAADHLHPPPTEQILTQVASRSWLRPLEVLFVGNLIPRKGLHRLVTALARLPAGSWHLTVVGSLDIEPSYVQQIRRLIDQYNLAHAVDLLGAVNDEWLQKIYGQSHVLAVPSFEGFGIVYLEAMSYGLPAIASTAGAAREIITPGLNGFLVDPDDDVQLAACLSDLLANNDRLYTMSIAARLRYDDHPTWGQTCSSVCEWLHEAKGMQDERRF